MCPMWFTIELYMYNHHLCEVLCKFYVISLRSPFICVRLARTLDCKYKLAVNLGTVFTYAKEKIATKYVDKKVIYIDGI